MKSKIFSRWLTLLIVVIHILYNNLYDIIVPNTSLKIITDKYRSLFVPAGYAFSIWGIIYIAILAYCVYQLLPSQKDKPFYDRINPPLMISMFLGMVWGIVFRESMITLSMFVILFSFLTAYGTPFREGLHASLHREARPWFPVIAAALCIPIVFFPVASPQLMGAALAAFLVPAILLMVSNHLFGGVNGDVVGASGEITRTVVLCALALIPASALF